MGLFGNRYIRRIPVIPAKAGIQRSGVNPVCLDSGLRRNDENRGWSNKDGVADNSFYTGNGEELDV